MFRKRAKPEKAISARRMMQNPTPAEKAITPWLMGLRNYSPPIKFRAQQVVAGWIPDFYCPKRRLVVEIDGGYHAHPEQRSKDIARDQILISKYGITVLRITNEEALNVPQLVASRVHSLASALPVFSTWNQGLKYKLQAIPG